MSPKSALAAAAVVLALGCAAPAAAEVTTYTFKGTISDGYDETGVFGAAGRELTGLSFTATFRRDDAAMPYYVSATYSEIHGGSFEDWRSPVLASLTIDGGGPIAFGQDWGRQLQGDESYEVFYFDAGDEGDFNDVGFRLLSMGASGPADGDYLPNGDFHSLPSLTAAATPHLDWVGDVVVDEYVYDDAGDLVSRNSASATFAPTSLTVTTAAVPEPAAWALMLTGFFGAGAAIRSRRRAVAWAS